MNPLAAKILVVEDEHSIAELIALHLRHHDFDPVVVHDSHAAQRYIESTLPHLVLLDWMLPGQSGESLVRQWRKTSLTAELPVIMLSARAQEEDIVKGLEAGVDDYITKPFSMQELMARIRAVLRRSASSLLTTEQLQAGDLKINVATYQVHYQNELLKLGPTEFKLLEYFMRHPDRVYTRAQLLNAVWGVSTFVEERTVDVHIKRLREALGQDAEKMIQTVRGVGYRFVNM